MAAQGKGCLKMRNIHDGSARGKFQPSAGIADANDAESEIVRSTKTERRRASR